MTARIVLSPLVAPWRRERRFALATSLGAGGLLWIFAFGLLCVILPRLTLDHPVPLAPVLPDDRDRTMVRLEDPTGARRLTSTRDDGEIVPSRSKIAIEKPAWNPAAGARLDPDVGGEVRDPGGAPPAGEGAVHPAELPDRNAFVFHDELPAVVTQVIPIYPELAKLAGIAGTVRVRVLVDRGGRVRDAYVTRSILVLDDAALEAARKWVFTPALANGYPVAVWVEIPVRFVLN